MYNENTGLIVACYCYIVPIARAVGNGPVGPAMAGPIIEPVILICVFFLFFIFNLFSDRTNNRASHFDFRNLCKYRFEADSYRQANQEGKQAGNESSSTAKARAMNELYEDLETPECGRKINIG